VEEAGQGRARHPELLVLGEPDAVSAARAIQAVNASGLPRWAVVLLGGDSADLADTVPAGEWQPALLARVFRSAVLQHELEVENLRLQGDLKTVARRISHDLGAPLGCIGTASHVVKVSLAPAALRSVALMIENIEESSREISQILERVNLVLRASGDPPAPARIAMAGVVAGVLRQLAPAIQKAEAIVTKPALWPEVNGVERWLEVIWWNLLQNALQHGGPAPQVELGCAPEEGGYRFSVADRGAAILPVVAARFFRPFDQLHLLPAPGLGLSIVQRLVALQGGQCGYERRGDGASVFFFTLPGLAAGRRRRAASSDVQAVAGGG
jgi:signal transduction histidine kinase